LKIIDVIATRSPSDWCK